MTNWLIFFLAMGLAAVAILAVLLNHRQTIMWMRAFSEKQGIPASILDGERKPEEPAAVVDNRKRVSVPVPGANLFRKVQ